MKKTLLYTCLLMLLAVAACKNQEDPSVITLNQSSYAIDPKGGVVTIELSSNAEYDIEIPSTVSWVKLLPNQAAAGYKHSFMVEENTEPVKREALVVFKDRKSSYKVVLTFAQDPSLSELQVLTKFYEATGGSAWTNNTNWCTGKPISEWYGVTVNGDGKVISLSLSSNNLVGSIPPEVELLRSLTNLILDNNTLSGVLPPDIGKLSELQMLHLYGNQLSGDIPAEIGGLQSLTFLNLSSNRFTSIPKELWSLPLLTYCYLSRNQLTGELPATIGSAAQLVRLDLCHNTLTGSIPAELASLKNLKELYLNNNQLSGAIPATIAGLAAIEKLALASNNLEGNVPVGFGMLSILGISKTASSLTLFGNKLSGVLPDDFISNPNFSSWDVEQYVLPQQDGYTLTLPNAGDLYTSTDYSQDGKVLVLQQATAGIGVDIVLMGDGFVDRDMGDGGKYEQVMRTAMEHYFSVEPTKSLRQYFNVYAVKLVSANEVFNTIGATTALEVSFGDGTHIEGNDNTCLAYAEKTPAKDINRTLITVVVNSDRWAGTTYLYYDPSIPDLELTIAYCPMTVYLGASYFEAVVHHEALGHGMGKLLDEYIYNDTNITAEVKKQLANSESYGWGANLSLTGSSQDVKWKQFIGHPSYSYVGVYEGGYFYSKGVWRPEAVSCMDDNRPYFNAPSRAEIVRRVVGLAGQTYSWDYFLSVDKYQPVRQSRTSAAKLPSLASPVVVAGSRR